MTSTDTPRPGDPSYRGQRRAEQHDESWVLDAPTLAEGLEQFPVQLGPKLTQAMREDQQAAEQLAETIRSAGVPDADTIMALEDTLRRPRGGGMTLRLGDVDLTATPYGVDVEALPPFQRFTLDRWVASHDTTEEVIEEEDGIPVVLVPADHPDAGAPYGQSPVTGRMLHRSTRDPRGVWRLTMVGNFPSGSKKAKAKLAKLPRRYQLVFGFANSIDADSFGGCELGTAFWQVLEDRSGWRGRRGLANSAVGSNRIGNGCLWRHRVYRCLDSAHFTIRGLPSGEFDRLDMPVVLLEDRVTGAIHAEVTIHNFARRYSKPWERRKVVSAIIRLVNRLTDAGIPVILRGDFNDSVDVVDELEEHTELRKAAPSERSIDMIFASEDIEVRRPREVEKAGRPRLAKVIDHGSITTVEHRIKPDADCPRELPRLPRIAA